MAIPTEVIALFKKESGEEQPLLVARALADIEGHLGETFLMATKDSFYLFTKRIGEEFKTVKAPYSSISNINVRDDRPFAYLQIEGEQSCELKFAGQDLALLEQAKALPKGKVEEIAPKIAQAVPPPPPLPSEPPPLDPNATAFSEPPPLPEDALEDEKPDISTEPIHPDFTPGKLTPLVAFSAAINEMVMADGIVETEELHQLRRMFSDETIEAGRDWLKAHSLDELVSKLDEVLLPSQRLCLLANLLEIAMSDGVLRTVERKLLTRFREALHIDEEDYEAIYEVLYVKNNLAVFDPAEG